MKQAFHSFAVPSQRVALFIDGENLSHGKADEIVAIADDLGQRGIRRVYGDRARIAGWRAQGTLQLIDSAQGKNAADMLLAIEAMEVALGRNEKVIAIASQDRDFSHLARKLAEYGVHVIGIGNSGPDCLFRKACSEYRELSKSDAGSGPAVMAPGPAKTHPDPAKLEKWIETAIGQSEGKQLDLARLANIMRERHGITKSDLPKRNWNRFLAVHPRFEIYDKNMVRLTRKKPPASGGS